jgi:hypothetical protein
MEFKMKSLLILIFVFSLSACSDTPSSEEAKDAIQYNLDQKQANLIATLSLFKKGGSSSKEEIPKMYDVISLDILGCKSDVAGQICDYSIHLIININGDPIEQQGHGKKRFIQIDGTWYLDESSEV